MKHANNFDSIESVITAYKTGEMIVVLDDEDRENEGDLMIAAEAVTPQDINFMAQYGRGLICLTLSKKRCAQLNLPLMVLNNYESQATNFTISIDASKNITTGISAKDRACTIQAAVQKNAQPTDLVQPGHIFPLQANEYGVLQRAGHTEAGCDLARLSGFEPASVIVEILNPDGSMARKDELMIFSKQKKLKITTIAHLIQYRLKKETTLEVLQEKYISNRFGRFLLVTFLDTVKNKVHLALINGTIEENTPVLVRVHVGEALSDLLGSTDIQRSLTLSESLEILATEKPSVLILLQQENQQDLLDLVEKIPLHQHVLPFSISIEADDRTYGMGAQMLQKLGVRKIIILGGSEHSFSGLSAFSLEVLGYQNKIEKQKNKK